MLERKTWKANETERNGAAFLLANSSGDKRNGRKSDKMSRKRVFWHLRKWAQCHKWSTNNFHDFDFIDYCAKCRRRSAVVPSNFFQFIGHHIQFCWDFVAFFPLPFDEYAQYESNKSKMNKNLRKEGASFTTTVEM